MVVASLFQFYYFLDIKATYRLLLQIFLCVVFVMQFYLTCWICTLAREESNRTGRIIYEIILKWQPVNFDKHEASNPSSLEVRPPLEDLGGEQSFNRSSSRNQIFDVENLLRRNLDRERVIKEINDFSLQLQQYRVVFTACNFFEINNGLFRGVSKLFTYVITMFVELPPFELYFQ
jgi:hypothetical protein